MKSVLTLSERLKKVEPTNRAEYLAVCKSFVQECKDVYGGDLLIRYVRGKGKTTETPQVNPAFLRFIADVIDEEGPKAAYNSLNKLRDILQNYPRTLPITGVLVGLRTKKKKDRAAASWAAIHSKLESKPSKTVGIALALDRLHNQKAVKNVQVPARIQTALETFLTDLSKPRPSK